MRSSAGSLRTSVLALVFTAAAALVLASGGCGSDGETAAFAGAQTIRTRIVELDGTRGVGFALRVRALRLTDTGWSVSATIVNRTPVSWTVTRPHVPGGTKFGLFVLDTQEEAAWRARIERGQTTPQLLATRFVPPLPRRFSPGDQWRGRFSGPGRIPRGRWVRIAFGRFTTAQAPPNGLPRQLVATTKELVRVL